jgi:hypothetical protein
LNLNAPDLKHTASLSLSAAAGEPERVGRDRDSTLALASVVALHSPLLSQQEKRVGRLGLSDERKMRW